MQTLYTASSLKISLFEDINMTSPEYLAGDQSVYVPPA